MKDKRAPIGYCPYCKKRLYETYAQHYYRLPGCGVYWKEQEKVIRRELEREVNGAKRA